MQSEQNYIPHHPTIQPEGQGDQPIYRAPAPSAPRKRRRRRLKPKVKYTLYALITFILLVVLRPWGWFVPTGGATGNACNTTDSVTFVPLHMRLRDQICQMPDAERFDRTVNNFIRKWEINGASLAIMKDGNLIYYKGYGYANKEAGTPVGVEHLFRIASLSKLITAVGIMKLEEKGKLRLDSKVFGPEGLLPQFTDYTDRRINSITVEHLLRHKGGFTVRAGDPMFSPMTQTVAERLGQKHAPSTDQMIGYALRTGLGYTPGGRTKYSNLGYLILSKVIEQVSGMGYEAYIRDSILAPAGCHDMHLAHNIDSMRRPNEVKYYESSDAEPVAACDGSGIMVPKCNGGNNVEGLMGAGGWIASPVELLLLVAAIDGDPSKPDILRPATIRKMVSCTKQELPIGWMKVKPNGDWIRTGSMAGTSAMLRRQSNGYTWVFITNTSSWKGARFPNLINGMLNSAFGRVDRWPATDMFEQLYEEPDNL